MPDPFTPSRLAQARKSLYGARPGGTRTSDTRASDLARIEREAFDEQNRVLKAASQAREDAAKAAEDQRKANETAAKAAAKQAKAEADAKLRAENNAREEAYRRDRRPMYVDADSRIQPIHTDDEWQKQQAEKGRKLQAEKDKKQAEDRAKVELDKVAADADVLRENDQTIQRTTQRQELERDGQRLKLKTIQKDFEDKLKAYDDGLLDLTPAQQKAAAGTVALAKERLAALDAAELERKKTVLDFSSQQDVRAAALKKQEAAIRRGELPEEETGGRGDVETQNRGRVGGRGGLPPAAALITDPAQFEAAAGEHESEVQAFDAELAQQQAKMAELEAENARLMSMPHAPADVSTDGKWHKDLIPKVNALGQAQQSQAQGWQARQEKIRAQAETLNASAKVMNEQARAEQVKGQEVKARQAAERKQQLADLAAAGHETQARKIRDLDGEADARLADIAEMYPENSPEREAAVKAVQQDMAAKQTAVGQEIEQQAQKAAQVYQDWGRGFAGNWITGETPAVDDVNRTGAVIDEDVQAVLKAKAKELGMSEKDLRTHLEAQRLMDWSTPSTSASNKQQSGVAHELAKKLDLIGTAEPTRTLPSGDIMPNPELGQSQAKFDTAIDSAIGTQAAKDKAKALWPQYREMWLESARATLETSETLPGVESYQDWRDKNAAHLGGRTENQKAELYIQNMEKRGWPRKFLDNVSANLMAGSHDILTAIYGTGAVMTGALEKATGAPMVASEVLSEAAAEKSQQAQRLTQAQGIEGISGLGQGIIGQGARILPGAIATMATGTMTGAMVAGAMQTGGMAYGDAYHSLIEQGYDHAAAWAQAAPASVAAGAMTAVLTKAFPGGVTALNNAANRTALQQGIQQAIRTFAASATSMGKAAVKGFADEVPQEILDEAFSQFAQGQAEGRAPREVVSEFLTGLPELIGAAGLMGAGGQVIGDRAQSTVVPPLGGAEIPGPPQGGTTSTAPATPSPASALLGPAQGTPETAAAAGPVTQSAAVVEGVSSQDLSSQKPAKAGITNAEASKPERWAAAEAALANFDATTTLPPEVADKTAQKGRVLLKIAQGAKAESLDNDDLHLVGLHRDDAGKITQGHMSKNGWKKGPNPNGSPQPVEMLNGEFVITDRQIERLRNKEVGLGALADAIALPAAERRQQIAAKAGQEVKGQEVKTPKTNETGTQSGPSPSAASDAAQGGAQEVAEAGNAPARGGQALDPPAAEELKPDLETGRGGDLETQSPSPPVPQSPSLDLQAEERAQQIAVELSRRGFTDAEAEAMAVEIVGEQGVLGDNYALQMSAPEFDTALKVRGWERHNAGGKTRYRRVMSEVEQVPGVQSAQRGEAKAEEVLKGKVTSSKSQVTSSGKPEPSAARQTALSKAKPLIEREDWQKEKARVIGQWQARIKAKRDVAMGKLSAGAKHPAQIKANEELREVIQRMNKLEEIIDTRYAGAFDDVILQSMGAGGGLYAKTLAEDAQGRATAVALVIDLEQFLEVGSKTEAGIERTLNEEMSHRVDLMVSSPAEAVALARAIHAARPGVFNAAWKQYHAVGIENGSVPAKPPAELSDQQAFEMYFEATRMIHQGAFTTEKSELPDVGLLRKIYLYLNRWIKQMRREIGKLPKDLRDAWQSRIDIAEIMLGKLQKQAAAADKAELENAEPPEQARRGDSEKGRLGAEIDDEIDAAWEAEQKARRKAPVFTPGQQALRGLRTITDPDNDEINIISRIALQGGMAVYSPKALKARAQEGKAKGGELDWLERADIPPFWKGVIFRRGTKQEVQAVLEQLHREGYFPGVAEAGDVTGEMLAAKIADVLARYDASKKGEVSNLDEAEGEHFGKLEAQRVEFERSTADGPLKVRPADLQVGDVMQVKGDDGKLHPVKVKGMETRPLESDEEFNPEANPGHRLGPDGPEVIESVTLEDGTTFGVQTIDGQEGLFVDEFNVKSGADWYDSLREAILSKKLTDEDALLHFMEHEGMGADAAWGTIVGGLQRKLGLSVKKAQKMLASVFDTSAKDQEWSESEKAAAMDSPLGAAAKRSLLEKPQYHSTPNETAAQSILQSGQVVPPVLPHSRGKLTPVVGRVYMAPSTETAAIYSLGGVMMGQVDQPGWAPWWDREGRDGKPRGRYGYVFQIDPDSVQDIQPDEDNVGELAFKAMDGKLPNAPYWLKSMGERLATSREKQDKWAYANYASLGKRMLKQMSDQQKLEMIERFNTNIAHAGPVRVLKAWKVDKARAGELAKDGSNLLDVAEPVPLNHSQTLASAQKRRASGPSLFGEDTLNFLGDRNTMGLGEVKSSKSQVPSSGQPETGFALESTTPAQLKAEAERKKLKEALQARQDKPLIGTQGDIGQMDMLGGNDLLSAPPAKVDPRQEVKATPSSSQVEPRGLADFGVKLGGARKDRVPTIQEELTDEDIARKPLSEIWPKAEIDSIEDTDLAAFATAVRGEIPTKPQRGYKLNVWVSKVKAVKELMRHAQEKGVPEMIAQWRSPKYNLGALADKVNLLQAMDREHWGRIGRVENYPDAYRYESGAGNMTKIPSPHATAEVDGKTIRATNLDDLQAAVLAKVSEGKTEPKMQFEVRGRTDGKTGIGTWLINKKGDSLYRPLKLFADVNAKEAFAYIQAHHDELVAAWESVKERDNVKETDLRRDTNRPRTAEDYRKGEDATPEMFTEAFGFRGVEFGNWVSQGANAKERQGMMNEAYDALHDLASILNVPTKALSLNGQLGLGFGSRGHGKFAAHYEPGTLVINLTKTRGAGSLAHEMFHALDHYFQRFRGTKLGYITEAPETRYVNTKTGHTLSVERWQQLQGLRGGRLVNEADWKIMEGVRPEVEESFAALVKALDASPMARRAALNDKGKQGYWGSVIERAARAFENYVIFKMQQKGYQNDYLANVVSIEDFARDPGRYPYLLAEEIEPVAKAFDDLFATIQTREEDGKVALFSAAKRSPAITALAQSARNPAAMPAATRGLFAQRPGASQPVKAQPGTGAEAWFPSQWGRDQVIEAAYQDATQGQSSAMVSLERVFLHAQKRQPGLKQADFLAAVRRAYDDGRVMLEGANSQAEIDGERLTMAGTPVGTAVRMAAARNDETRMANEEGLSSAAKRSEPDRGRVGVGGRVGGQTDELAHEAATSPLNDLPEPTEAQKEAGNYPKGHVTIGGHEISIENPAGSKRRPEWPALKDHYGYFKGTNAKDGDHVDVFVKPGTAKDYQGPVHVVRQNKVERLREKDLEKRSGGEEGKSESPSLPVSKSPSLRNTGVFDEYKVMLGYPTAEEARAAYLRNYEPGWPGLERMTTHTAAEFARIKESVFTVKPKDVPGVRESDQVLASGAKRGQNAAMADPDKAAQNAEPSPGGLSEAERLNILSQVTKEQQRLERKTGLDDADEREEMGREETSRLEEWLEEQIKHEAVNLTLRKLGAQLDGFSNKSEASYWSLPNQSSDFRIRVASHDAVYSISDTAVKIDLREITSVEDAIDEAVSAVAGLQKQTAAALANDGDVTQEQNNPAASVSGMDTRLGGQTPPSASQVNPESSRAAGGTLGSAAKRSALGTPIKGILDGLSKADWNHTDRLLTNQLAGPVVKTAQAFKKAGGWVAGKVGIPDAEAMLEYLAEWSVQGHASRHNVSAEAVDVAALKAQHKAALDAAKAAKMPAKERKALEAAQSRELVAARRQHLTPAQMKEFKAGQKAQLRRLMNQVKRQIVPDSAIPGDILAKRIEMNAKTSLAQEKALDVAGRAFKGKAKFTDMALDEHFSHPETKRRMFLAMDDQIGGGVTMASLTPEERKVAETLKSLREQHAQERLKAGRLSLDAYHRLKDGMPHYYAEDVKAERSMLRRMALGLKRVLAQRGTAFHIVDTATKDADGADALVPWTPPKSSKATWWFRTKEQMDAHYEQHLAEQILAAKRTTSAQSMAELDPADRKALKSYGWMTDADRAALAGVTRESINAPSALTKQQRDVIERLEEQLRKRFQKKVPLTFDEHQKAGLIMDPFYAIGRQLAEAGHDNATAEFFNYIAAHPDYTSDAAQAGYTEMPDQPSLGRLAAKWVRDDVAAEVREMTEIPHMVAQFYDWMLSLFKFGHTVLNAGSHIRNVIGNISFAHIAGNNPLNPGNWQHYGQAMSMLRSGEGVENLYKLGILGGDYLTAEIKRTLRQLMPDAKTVMQEIESGNLTWLLNFKEYAARKFEGMTKIPGVVMDGAAAAWKWEDDIYKVAAFVKAKSMGMTDEQATAHVRKWFTFYDGGNSSLLKNVGRFVFPFLSFKRESARILGNALKERPLAALTTLLLPRALTQASLTVAEWKIFMYLLGTGLGIGDDRDKEDIIKDMKGKAGRLLAPITDASLFSILLPWRDENGGLMQYDLSAVHPFADWLSTRIEDDSTMKWWQRAAQDIAAGSPFVGLFGEMAMNKDFFSGSKIWEDDMPDSEAAGNVAAHAWKKLAPPHVGVHPVALKRALERSPSKLMPARSFWMQLSRTLGVDIKPAGPDLYRKADEYRKANNLPSGLQGETFSKDAAGRARAELYRLGIQPVIDVEAFSTQVERLEALGKPVAPKDLMDLFERRQPETIMARKAHQQKFLRTLPPESARIITSAQKQQQEALPRAKAALSEANALSEARKKMSYTPKP